MERPYFLMGAVTEPVYQWRWTSRPRRAVAGLARAIDHFDTLATGPAAQARYDHDARMAVSTWYFLALDRPTPASVVVSPVIAMAVALGLGMLVIARAQGRGRG